MRRIAATSHIRIARIVSANSGAGIRRNLVYRIGDDAIDAHGQQFTGAIDVVHRITKHSEPGFVRPGDDALGQFAMIDIECDAIEPRQSIQPICRQLIEKVCPR